MTKKERLYLEEEMKDNSNFYKHKSFKSLFFSTINPRATNNNEWGKVVFLLTNAKKSFFGGKSNERRGKPLTEK